MTRTPITLLLVTLIAIGAFVVLVVVLWVSSDRWGLSRWLERRYWRRRQAR